MKFTCLLAALLLMSGVAMAQPRPGGGPGGGPPPGERGPGAGPREGRGPGMLDDDRGPGGGFGGAADPYIARFDRLRGYLDAVDRYARLTRDPQNSGIAAVVSANDILRPRGADVAIEDFNRLLPEVKTPAVQRAIRITLVDLYKAAGKQDQALEQLKLLMTADTSGEPSLPPPPPGGPRQ